MKRYVWSCLTGSFLVVGCLLVIGCQPVPPPHTNGAEKPNESTPDSSPEYSRAPDSVYIVADTDTTEPLKVDAGSIGEDPRESGPLDPPDDADPSDAVPDSPPGDDAPDSPPADGGPQDLQPDSTPTNTNPPPLGTYKDSWYLMHYRGQYTPVTNTSRWLTNHPQAVQRHEMYIQAGKYTYPNSSNAKTKPYQYTLPKSDRRFRNEPYVDMSLYPDRAPKLSLWPYRMQLGYQYDRHSPGHPPNKKNPKQNVFQAYGGWPNWSTEPGYELHQRFSIRFPTYNNKQWPAYSPVGLDAPHMAANIYQLRSRYHNPPHNIPMHIIWRYKDVVIQSSWRSGHKKLFDVDFGKWYDFLILSECSTKSTGKGFQVWVRKEGETKFKMVDEYKGAFYGTLNKDFETDMQQLGLGSKSFLGSPSYGLYTSTRLATSNGIDKMIKAGVKRIGLQFTHIELLQVKTGARKWPQLVSQTEKEWKHLP